jgi:hypothetical protein
MIELSQIAVALLDVVLGLFVLRARPHNAANRAFAAQSLVFAGWVLGVAGFQNPRNLDLSFGFAFGFASLIPVAFLLFAHCYPSTVSWSSPLYVRVIFATGIVFMLLSLATDLIVHDAEVTSVGLSRKVGPLYPIFAAYFITTWCVGVSIFVRKWRSSRGLARAQFHYLGAGLIGGSLGWYLYQLARPPSNRRFALQLDRTLFQSGLRRIHCSRDHPAAVDGPSALHSQGPHDHDRRRVFDYASSAAGCRFLASAVDGSRRSRAGVVSNGGRCCHSSYTNHPRRCQPTTGSLRLSHSSEPINALYAKRARC